MIINKKINLEQLTFTRFIAAILIVVFHYGKNIFPFNIDGVTILFQHANVGVSYFFILSGFVMVIAYGNKKKINFFKYITKRLARIYPIYFLAIVFNLMYLIISDFQIDSTSLMLNILLIQSWVPGYALSFNAPGWTLSVEMFFYLTFPFLYNHLYKKYSFKKLVALISIFFIISQITCHILRYSLFYNNFFPESHDLIFYFPLMHFSEFLLGNLAGLFFFFSRTKKYDFYIISLILSIFILFHISSYIIYNNGMLAFIFIPLIIFISLNNGFITKILKTKALVLLGEASYSIYILQQPMYLWVNKIMGFLNIKNPSLIFYTFLIILICSSIISFRYIENPIKKKINNKLKFQ